MAFKVTKVFSEAHSPGGNDFHDGMFRHLRTLASLFLPPLLFAQTAYPAGRGLKLIWAAGTGYAAKVEKLPEQGADVNAKEDIFGIRALKIFLHLDCCSLSRGNVSLNP